jgi:hypothetical protein
MIECYDTMGADTMGVDTMGADTMGACDEIGWQNVMTPWGLVMK